jgi:membrane protease YdiL (CAAX protease family)
MRYSAHEHLVAPARDGRSGLGWSLLGCLAILILTYYGSVVFYDIVRQVSGLTGKSLASGSDPLTLLSLLFSFIFWIMAIATVQPIIHKRSFRRMLGITLWDDFRRVCFALIVLYIALWVLPPWDSFENTVSAMTFGHWLSILPLALSGLLIQVAAEEILFRGYLQQQLAARVSSPLVWIGLPSILFGLAHYDPSLGSNTWLFVCWAVLFGGLMADLTARSGSLGPAIAVHLFNNMFAMLLVSPPDSLSGLALFHFTFPLTDEATVRALLPIDFAVMLVSWLAARLAIRA